MEAYEFSYCSVCVFTVSFLVELLLVTFTYLCLENSTLVLQDLTAIVDRDELRCFVLPLNRTIVYTPGHFMEYIEKFKVLTETLIVAHSLSIPFISYNIGY